LSKVEDDEKESDCEWEDAREYLSDDNSQGDDTFEAAEVVENTKPVLAEWAVPRVSKPSIIAKLHQHGYDKRVASAAMFALQLPALDWTEHHLRRAVEYLETH